MKTLIKDNLIKRVGEIVHESFDTNDPTIKSLTVKLIDAVEAEFLLNKSFENKEVTVLLSDLRGFTSIAEKYSAQDIMGLLNRYLQKMSEVIYEFGGTIDKFMGDAIMVLFGAPQTEYDDLQRALACAIKMQLTMEEINEESKKNYLPSLFMGIGINTGHVVAGNLGSELHSEYTVIGDEVNLASRVEAHSLRGQILISENCYIAAQDYIRTGNVNSVMVKGKQHPVNMYELLETTLPYPLKAPKSEGRKSPRVPLEGRLAFQIVSDKSVLPKEHIGQLIDISYGGIFAVSPVRLNRNDNIKITISLSLMGHDSTEIYARVLKVNPFEGKFECHFEFTSIDDKAQATIKEFVDHEIERL